MEELDLPELSSKQIEELCVVAEEIARKYVMLKVPPESIGTLNISAEAKGTKPVTLTVAVDIAISPLMKDFDEQNLVDEAVEKAFASARKYLGELRCRSQK